MTEGKQIRFELGFDNKKKVIKIWPQNGNQCKRISTNKTLTTYCALMNVFSCLKQGYIFSFDKFKIMFLLCFWQRCSNYGLSFLIDRNV